MLGWIDLFKRRSGRGRHGFFDPANQSPTDPPGYDVLDSKTSQRDAIKSPEPSVSCVSPGPRILNSPESDPRRDYLGREAKYNTPQTSFSCPRPPSATGGGGWAREQVVPVSPIGSFDEVNEKKN